MPKILRLSGKDVIQIFKNLGFDVVSQKGSHVKLRRISSSGNKQTLTIPNHKELGTGTTKAIYNQALRYETEETLYGFFHGT